ncbi:ATP-binding protein [Chitinibacter sp. GC72]|uniref:ATP-binding protein n=1 Tax=Chitinibacter sp. GC72 TaxID=1526917 RepID=UPI0012F87ECC|nr:ATP-binding protein [Chitinibacter sp. GC72]
MPNSTTMTDELAAQLAHIQGIYHQQPDLARQHCEQLIGQAREQHATLLQIHAAELYGKIMDHMGEPISSRNLLYEALQQAQAIHNFKLEARVCEQIARSYYTAGDYPTALQSWLRCIELAEFKDGEASVWMLAKIGVGQVYDALGECQTALLFHNKALSRIGEVDDAYLHAKILINIGVVQLKLDSLKAAEQALTQSLDLCLKHDFPDYAATSFSRLAEISLKENALDQAMELLSNALHYARRVNYRWGEANILHNMALIHSRQHDDQAALERVFIAQGIARAAQFSPVLMRLHQSAAHFAEQTGQISLAISELKAGIALQTHLQHSNQSAENDALVRKTNLRASTSSKLVDLANHHLIEHGDSCDFWPLIAQAGCDILQLDRVSIWQLSADAAQLDNLYCSEQRLYPARLTLYREQIPVFFSSLARKQATIAHDAEHHHYAWDLAQHYLLPRQVHSVMIFQLQYNEQQILLMFEHQGTQRNWLPDEVQYGHQLSNIAARALSNEDRRHFQDEIHILNARLSEAHTELEQRVEERTQVLAQSNRELEQAMHQLVQTEKMAALGRLVSGIASELVTPLEEALLYSQSLNQSSTQIARQLADNALKKSDLLGMVGTIHMQSSSIEQKIAKASELVSQFKLVAVDTSSERRRTFNLYQTVQDLVRILSRSLAGPSQQILLAIDPAIELDSYPGALEQILTHLIQNSLQHGLAGRENGMIELNAQQIGQQLVLSCCDNGSGIAPGLLAQVMEPFVHGDQAHSGLGLYISSNLAREVLGGKLYVESSTKQYTLIKLEIPLRAP